MSPGPPRAPADVAAALAPAVTGIVEGAGLVLDEIEVRPAGRRRVVRVVVDGPDEPGSDDGPAPGPDLDAVAAVSRALSTTLDRDGAGVEPDGEYTLEVTTPGTDRPLTAVRHWRRAWLRRVAVTTTAGDEVGGRVGGVTDEGTVTLAATDRRGRTTVAQLALAEVARAVVEVEFKPAPPAEVEALRAARGGGTGTGAGGTVREQPGQIEEESS